VGKNLTYSGYFKSRETHFILGSIIIRVPFCII
jgi:hypothetical protein